MDFFNSLTLDLKLLVAGIVGCALLALFAGNQKTEKRYMIVFAVLAAAGIYRFTHLPGDGQPQRSAATPSAPQAVPVAPQHKPLVSTFAK
ncbi:hypothetical protein WG902_09785 [Ramlibacter sp. PS3R-8]|uniref:hypothetical protein n=1 Tax=Ramlibacter sp. PS3R-8 TaxID=3133437 RepID=UPI0030A153AE